jgi:hypothetical protein
MLVNRENAKEVLAELIWPEILGVILFQILGCSLFKVSLWRGASEIQTLHSPLIWCGFVLCASVLIGCWSVGRAIWHLLAISWRWARLYSAGGK